MALELTPETLNARIDGLRTGWIGHQTKVAARNRAYLRAFSPDFDTELGEHDQWAKPKKQEDEGHARSSYNVTRPVVEDWSALEMSALPSLRWREAFIPSPVPSLDPIENARRVEAYQTQKLVARHIATLREQTLSRHIRRSKLKRHAYRAVRRKNLYGHSWLKTTPDLTGPRTFRVFSRIDPSTVYPVWSAKDERRLDAILVAYRRTAQSVNAEFPDFLPMDPDGLSVQDSGWYYLPSNGLATDRDRHYVWVEDYWVLDDEWAQEVSDSGEPVRSRVVNFMRINGKPVPGGHVEYPGWRSVPYVPWINDDERDELGFSDAGTMLPIQDGFNRFLSAQDDVIYGESRPRFKYHGDADRQITLDDEEVIPLDLDEDIEQIAVRLDVFPTQVHGQQLMELLGFATGINDSVRGKITQAANSGRALAQAWRAVALRQVPRTYDNEWSLETLLNIWLDWMELYGWDSARDLYNGDRDYELDFPNQEPRDFAEVSLEALNRYGAGAIDLQKLMELTGEQSPDEMLQRVRAEYMDPVLHPEKSQSYLLLQRLKNAIAIEAQQAGIQAATAQAQLAQMAASPPGGAPSGAGTVEQQAGQAANARNVAAAQAAPRLGEGQNGPAAVPGGGPNPASTVKTGTLVQDGKTFNRIIASDEI